MQNAQNEANGANSVRELKFGTISAPEVEQYQEIINPAWDLVYEQLTAGPFGASNVFAASGNAIIYKESHRAAHRVRGSLQPGLVVVCVPLECAKTGRWWGGDCPENSLAFGRNRLEIDLSFREGYENLVLLAKESAFREQYETLAGKGPGFLDRKGNFLEIAPSRFRALGGELLSILGAVNTNGGSGWSAEAFDTLLVSALADATSQEFDVRSVESRKKALVSKTVSEIERAFENLSVPQLCMRVGVSRRTLEYTFQDYMGVAPAEYIKKLRLNRCRIRLAEADPSELSVKEIASSLGFLQSGRFATEYREMFGEFPSETLSRRSKTSSGRIPFGTSQRA